MDFGSWSQICSQVRTQMADFVFRSMAPLVVSYGVDQRTPVGTGNYLQLGHSNFILTCQHVIRDAEEGELQYYKHGGSYRPCSRNVKTTPWPIDVALVPLGQDQLRGVRFVSTTLLDTRYRPVRRELLFWIAVPGTNAGRQDPVTEKNAKYSWFGSELDLKGKPVLIQQTEEHLQELVGFDAERHIALLYPSLAYRNAGESLVGLPHPKGMSGGFLWDTRYVACYEAGLKWTPQSARVCGIIRGHQTKPELVTATKIEFARDALLQFMREEVAYFRWIERGRPVGSPEVDWEQAIRTVPSLW